MAISLLIDRTNKNKSTPYAAGYEIDSYNDGTHPNGTSFAYGGDPTKPFVQLSQVVRRNNGEQPQVPFAGYNPDTLHYEMKNSTNGNAPDNDWFSYWGVDSSPPNNNTPGATVWYYYYDFYKPYAATKWSGYSNPTNQAGVKSRVFFNNESYVTLPGPNAYKAYAISLINRSDNTGQGYTDCYSGYQSHMMAHARVGNQYKVSFYAMCVTSTTGGGSTNNYNNGNGAGFCNISSNQLKSHFDTNHTSTAVKGELEVWVFAANQYYNAFNTGDGGTNTYKLLAPAESANGVMHQMGTNEGIRMKIPEGDLSNTEWTYFEYMFELNQDNAQGDTRYITTRIDNNTPGSSVTTTDKNGNNPVTNTYFPSVSIANWCIEPMNISMLKRMDGTYDASSNRYNNKPAAHTDMVLETQGPVVFGTGVNGNFDGVSYPGTGIIANLPFDYSDYGNY